ncbi:MAG TPA: hypothetical protein V6D33_08990 [Cyanophyceae cyanobacterium]
MATNSLIQGEFHQSRTQFTLFFDTLIEILQEADDSKYYYTWRSEKEGQKVEAYRSGTLYPTSAIALKYAKIDVLSCQSEHIPHPVSIATYPNSQIIYQNEAHKILFGKELDLYATYQTQNWRYLFLKRLKEQSPQIEQPSVRLNSDRLPVVGIDKGLIIDLGEELVTIEEFLVHEKHRYRC